MRKTVFTFGLLALALLLLFELSTYSIVSGNLKIEIAIALVAVIFFIIGIYINRNSLARKTLNGQQIDQQKIRKLGISKREYEVLCEISKGFSNKEIADKLFVSESTVKTHVSNLLIKLNARRRTQAIKKAKEYHIL